MLDDTNKQAKTVHEHVKKYANMQLKQGTEDDIKQARPKGTKDNAKHVITQE